MLLYAALISFVPLILGIALLSRGWRGVVLDQHPLCRKCGFDLIGKPETSTRCPECGSDLNRPKAIRIGHRKRGAKSLGVGLTLTLLALAILSAGIWANFQRAGLISSLPTWWLTYEINSKDPVSRVTAVNELSKRFNANKLTASQLDAIADRALRHQADLKQTWSPIVGDLLERMRRAGKLPDAQWKRYAAQSEVFTADIRLVIRIGDPIFYVLREGTSRAGNRMSFGMRPRTQVFVDDAMLHDLGGKDPNTFPISDRSNFGFRTPPAGIITLQPGMHNMRIIRSVQIADPLTGRPLTATTQAISKPIRFLPPTESRVNVVRNPALADKIKQAIQITALPRTAKFFNGSALEIKVDHAPVGVGFDVIARLNGVELAIGRIACPANQPAVTRPLPTPFYNSDSSTADIILRSSVQAATETTDTFEVWEGEIEFKNFSTAEKPSKPVTPVPKRR